MIPLIAWRERIGLGPYKSGQRHHWTSPPHPSAWAEPLQWPVVPLSHPKSILPSSFLCLYYFLLPISCASTSKVKISVFRRKLVPQRVWDSCTPSLIMDLGKLRDKPSLPLSVLPNCHPTQSINRNCLFSTNQATTFIPQSVTFQSKYFELKTRFSEQLVDFRYNSKISDELEFPPQWYEEI